VIISDEIAATFRPAGVPGRAHVLGPPAGLRVDSFAAIDAMKDEGILD